MKLKTAFLLVGVAYSSDVFAQLLDKSKVDDGHHIDAPGGVIDRSLQDQIGPGQGDLSTFGSSIYVIKRDPARSIRRGRQLFQRKFSQAEGVGPRVSVSSTGDVTVARALGAGLSDSCASCHGRPKGAAGAGGDVATRPDSRDAPHLFGLGLMEQLADEMTRDLRAIRDEVVAASLGTATGRFRPRAGSATTRPLVAKGVSFGTISAVNGVVNTSGVVGVNPDLRVRPFFAQGGTISIREFLIGAFNDEMGLQAYDPILCAVTDPASPQVQTSPAGFVFDPAKDTFSRPPACSPTADPDGDGVKNELDPALVDHMEFYLLNYFKPGQYEVTQRAQQGVRLMQTIGCTSCHVQNLTVNRDRRVADVQTDYDPARGIFNDLFATASTRFTVVPDGDRFPLVLPAEQPFVVRNFFSDLKRHDLGPAFHEREYDGTLVTQFVTEPLWGVATTAPYGHDGRSINLDAVIRRHGGEAEQSRRRYAALRDDDQHKIQEFLETLVLFPPDDTASNLNPGVPGTNAPQDPGQHGSIRLPALFQIADLGAE
jgi:hypothetical protein